MQTYSNVLCKLCVSVLAFKTWEPVRLHNAGLILDTLKKAMEVIDWQDIVLELSVLEVDIMHCVT